MRFQTPLLVLASLLTFVSGEADASRSHVRDFSIEVREAVPSDDEFANIQKRAPVIPTGKDVTKLHVWTRLDTDTTVYKSKGDHNYDGLNQLMKDTGGKHVDLIVGNPKGGYKQIGLEFSDSTWKTKTNADGSNVKDYSEKYAELATEQLTYKGQVGDGRKTLNSITTMAKTEITGKVYNHLTYNCATFANDLVSQLNVK